MEHGEARRRREVSSGNSSATHQRSAPSRSCPHPLKERRRELRIDLDGGQASDPLAEQIGREPGPGPISRRSSPRSAVASSQGSMSLVSISVHRGLERMSRCSWFIGWPPVVVERFAAPTLYDRAVAVSSSSANKVTSPATPGLQEVGGPDQILAGTYPFEIGEEVVTGWHFHDLHQLEYAFEGTAQVETAAARYLLPPQQAIWIPAGVEHCTTLSRVRTLSVFFDPSMGLAAGEDVRVIPVEPVVREMILHAGRWPITRATSDAEVDAYFDTLGRLITDQLDQESPLCLPTSDVTSWWLRRWCTPKST